MYKISGSPGGCDEALKGERRTIQTEIDSAASSPASRYLTLNFFMLMTFPFFHDNYIALSQAKAVILQLLRIQFPHFRLKVS